MMLTSSAVAGACSEDGLRYFTKYGVSRAYFRFHELVEEARCRKEPEFLVNLAQMYKSGSNDGANACRALLAYMDALQSPELSPPYPRVARKGQRSVGPDCKAFAGQSALVTEFFYQSMREARELASQGRFHHALREYRLLMYLRPKDERPLNGFCKTARLSRDRDSVAFCESRQVDLQSTVQQRDDDSVAGWAWTTTSLALISAGVTVWQGLTLYDNYQAAWAAHDRGRAAGADNPDSPQVAIEQGKLTEASRKARRAEVMTWISGGLTIGFSIAATTLWLSDDGGSITFVPGTGLGYQTTF